MKTRFIIVMLLAISSCWLAGESVTPADIQAGKLVPRSTSPDKKHCLLEVFHDETTQNSGKRGPYRLPVFLRGGA